jgi:hypothetical protein
MLLQPYTGSSRCENLRSSIQYVLPPVSAVQDPLGIGFLLADVLLDVTSAQLLQKPLQVFFCSDEVWNIKKYGIDVP